MNPDDLQTGPAIAAELGVTVYRVRYAIESRGIKPVIDTGAHHLYGPAEQRAIRRALAETAKNPAPGRRIATA